MFCTARVLFMVYCVFVHDEMLRDNIKQVLLMPVYDCNIAIECVQRNEGRQVKY